MKLIYVALYTDVCMGRGYKEELIGIALNDKEVEVIKNNYNEKHKNDYYAHRHTLDGNCVFEIKDFDNKYVKKIIELLQ